MTKGVSKGKLLRSHEVEALISFLRTPGPVRGHVHISNNNATDVIYHHYISPLSFMQLAIFSFIFPVGAATISFRGKNRGNQLSFLCIRHSLKIKFAGLIFFLHIT